MSTAQRAWFDSIAAAFGARYDTRPAFAERRALFVEAGRAALARAPHPAPLHPAPESPAQAPARPRCLDIGCGPGTIALALAEEGIELTGVDSSAAMIAQARAAARARGSAADGPAAASGGGDGRAGSCTFFEEELEAFLARPAAQGERRPLLIVCSSVLEYLPDPAAALRAMCARLAPSGTLAVSLPNRRSLLRRLEPFAQRLVPRASRYLDQLGGAAHTAARSRLDVEGALRIARDCGLSCAGVRHFGFPNLAGGLLKTVSGSAAVGTLSLLTLVAPGRASQVQRPLRIYVNATSARLGGGVTVMKHLLPALAARDGGRHTWTVAVRAEVAARIDPGLPRVALVSPRGSGGRLRPLWEQAGLPAEARGADLIFAPAGVASLAATRPQVLMLQNLAPFDASVLQRAGARERVRLLLLRELAIGSARRAKAVLFISAYARAAILPQLGIDPARARTVHLGRDPAFAPAAAARAKPLLARLGIAEPYLLCVSDFYRYKNLVELVEGFARARGSLSPEATLVLAGAEPDRAYAREVREAARRAGVAGSVRFLGPVPYADLPPLYAAAQLFVFPSSCESFPNILIEALASGAPTLSSRAGPMPELAGDGADYFDPFDPDAIAACLARACGDAAGRAALSLRGQARAARYSWDATALGVLSALEKAAAE